MINDDNTSSRHPAAGESLALRHTYCTYYEEEATFLQYTDVRVVVRFCFSKNFMICDEGRNFSRLVTSRVKFCPS